MINIEQLYEKYGPMVLRRCRQLLCDEALALDAMQEVFVQVVMKKEKLTDTYPSSLLYTIATNTALNMIRAKNRRMEISEQTIIESIAAIDDTANNYEHRSLLDKIFKHDKISTRYIATLHFVDGLTLEEVAGETGMSVSGIRKRLRDLKDRVREFKEFIYA
jgi:RNA polymerase sigma-70 factor, ECF subfamily